MPRNAVSNRGVGKVPPAHPDHNLKIPGLATERAIVPGRGRGRLKRPPYYGGLPREKAGVIQAARGQECRPTVLQGACVTGSREWAIFLYM